ncbi:MAG: hypothetical protein AMJ55_10565 [Gammaproteobacteria bacterium SG8_15]|nr:MAG: hypothetical protein AMJ55_10565 [Gammaproteobacteria bacterium SG8_15]
MSYLKKINNVNRYVLLAGILAGLAGCGGGDETEGGLPGSATGPGGTTAAEGDPQYNPPHTITVTYPFTDAIENLGGGVYRRRGTLVVTDSEGNPVADGVRINLFVMDSVFATGTILGADSDSISGTTLTDTAPLQADGVTPTTFDMAVVTRNGTQEFIDPSDHVLLFNAEESDKVRIVADNGSGGAVKSANLLGVSSNYISPYPNVVYDGSTVDRTTQYIVGASLLGANVSGEGGTPGYAVTSGGNGIAPFYVTYPADEDYILVGCQLHPGEADLRHPPNDSAQTYLVASVNNDPNVSAVDSEFCFSPIAGGVVELNWTEISSPSGWSHPIGGTVRDGGDSVPLPFSTVVIASVGEATVTVDGVDTPVSIPTDINGSFAVTISASGASGNTATVTFYGNGGTATGELTMNVN